MLQLQLIFSVVEWERKLAFEEDRLVNHRFEPYVNYLAAAEHRQQGNEPRNETQPSADFIKALNLNL